MHGVELTLRTLTEETERLDAERAVHEQHQDRTECLRDRGAVRFVQRPGKRHVEAKGPPRPADGR